MAFAWTGAAEPPHWSAATAPVTFFDAKGIVDRVAMALDVPVVVEPHEEDYLVKGQSAAILCGGQRLGTVGRVTPAVAEHHGIPREDVVLVAEIDLDAAAMHTRAATRVEPLPRFPSVSRDIALLVDDTLPAATLRHTIRTAAPPTLVHVREFDRYQGTGIPEGKLSLAVRLTFRSAERTLTDAEVQTAVDAVLSAVRTQHGAVQR